MLLGNAMALKHIIKLAFLIRLHQVFVPAQPNSSSAAVIDKATDMKVVLQIRSMELLQPVRLTPPFLPFPPSRLSARACVSLCTWPVAKG